MVKYIKLENRILGLLKEVEDSNIRTYLVPVYLYISCNVNRLDEVNTNIEDIVKWCGLKPNRHEGKSNDNIKKVLTYLKDKDIINTNKNILELSQTKIFKIYYEEKETNIIKLNTDHIRKILNIDKNYSTSRLLTYYCYTVANSKKVDDKYSICDSRKMANEINISLDTAIKYNTELLNLDIVTLEKPKQETKKIINYNVTLDKDILDKAHNILNSKLTKATIIKLNGMIDDFGKDNIINSIDMFDEYNKRYLNNTEFSSIIHKENTFLLMIRQNLPCY